MKTSKQVKAKLKDLRKKSLNKALREIRQPCPENCRHALLNQEGASLCGLGARDSEEWNGNLCDQEVADACSFFVPKVSEARVREDFKEKFYDPQWLRENRFDLYLMTWVLEHDSTEEPEESLSWFDRIRRVFRAD